jgi:hypothetical protein
MTDTDILSNQTKFFEDEVFGESPPTLPVEEDPLQAEKDAASKKRKRAFILFGTVGVSVLFVGLAVAVLVAPEALPQLTVTPSPISIEQQTDQSQIRKRLDELESDVIAADPIEVGFPFPPVTSDLFLDQKQRR